METQTHFTFQTRCLFIVVDSFNVCAEMKNHKCACFESLMLSLAACNFSNASFNVFLMCCFFILVAVCAIGQKSHERKVIRKFSQLKKITIKAERNAPQFSVFLFYGISLVARVAYKNRKLFLITLFLTSKTRTSNRFKLCFDSLVQQLFKNKFIV
jgi:hypothetical protein